MFRLKDEAFSLTGIKEEIVPCPPYNSSHPWSIWDKNFVGIDLEGDNRFWVVKGVVIHIVIKNFFSLNMDEVSVKKNIWAKAPKITTVNGDCFNKVLRIGWA